MLGIKKISSPLFRQFTIFIFFIFLSDLMLLFWATEKFIQIKFLQFSQFFLQFSLSPSIQLHDFFFFAELSWVFGSIFWFFSKIFTFYVFFFISSQSQSQKSKSKNFFYVVWKIIKPKSISIEFCRHIIYKKTPIHVVTASVYLKKLYMYNYSAKKWFFRNIKSFLSIFFTFCKLFPSEYKLSN